MKNHKRLNILHLVYDHPDNPWCGGGGAIRTWAINNILCNLHDITVYCGAFPGAQKQDKPYRIRYLGKADSYIESRLKFIWGSRLIGYEDYDLIVEEFSYYAPVLSLFTKRPVVTVLHGHHGFKSLQARGFLGLVSLFSEYFVLPFRRSLILVSEHLKSVTHPDANVTVIGMGVNVPGRLPPSEEKYVLFLGRLDIWHKGLDTLIKAWALLPSDTCHLPLYIVGGGEKSNVQNIIDSTGAKNVHLIGRVDYNKAMEIINQSAFLCMPSRMEGFGLVAAEASVLGKPVIVSTIPSLKKIIPHELAGLHVPVDNPSKLSEAIQRLISDDEFRKRLSYGAKKLGHKYKWDQVASQQEDFYYETYLKFHKPVPI